MDLLNHGPGNDCSHYRRVGPGHGCGHRRVGPGHGRGHRRVGPRHGRGHRRVGWWRGCKRPVLVLEGRHRLPLREASNLVRRQGRVKVVDAILVEVWMPVREMKKSLSDPRLSVPREII